MTLINPFAIGRRLFRHRALLWQFVWRDIELQHKGSFLGVAWAVISPLLLFGAYAFVFLVVFNGRFGVVASETRLDYAIGIFLSLAILQLVQESITLSPLTVVNHPNYVKKVVFPLEILPTAVFGAALFRCAISLSLVILAVAFWGPGLAATAWWLPVIVILLAMFSLGLTWTLAALGVFLRDLAPVMQFFAVLLMFMSGVFYSLNKIPHVFAFLRYNPLYILIEEGRGALLWHLAPTAGDLVYVGLVSGGLCLFGNLVFCVLKPAFADVI